VVANGYVGPVDTQGGPSFSLPSVPVQLDGAGPALRRAPEHGEHTELVLLELGYDWDSISALRDEGVIP
jgi:crotonobetainyl-CoA:carnitine CoA-transferase CaiB-like acyl-CoA transferase